MPLIADVIERLRARSPSKGGATTWVEDTLERGLLPVYTDWERYYALTPQADAVSAESAAWLKQVELVGLQRNAVLAQASTRYPELASLRPVRGPQDVICPWCKGAGSFTVERGPQVLSPGNVTCGCGGLGWVPAESVT